MASNRKSLPFPPKAEAVALGLVAPPARESILRELLERRDELEKSLANVETEIDRLIMVESLCGPDNLQDVELYDGTLGVSKTFVALHEPKIGQLQWVADLPARFAAPGASPGNVNGQRWGSGGLISRDHFLTAGHCFDPKDEGPEGWVTPKRNGSLVPASEIASLMNVNFNYQANATSGATRAGESFPVLELVEYRFGGLDFAIVRLGPNSDGEFPGDKYGALAIAAVDLTAEGATLCLIQHPNGRPKQIEAGPLRDNVAGRITYSTIDTLGGSSGSPILSEAGEIVGVHTNGGCTQRPPGGFNRGVAIGVIKTASAVL